jgi:threonine/homoserine/homoserine lactone efflux protein
MSDAQVLAATLSIMLVGAMSPGASFLLVAQRSVMFCRRDGVAMALGMGAAAVVFNVVAILGFAAVLNSLQWLKALGGIYLLYLAFKTWKTASVQIGLTGKDGIERRGTLLQSFWIGLTAHLLNPKALLFYVSALSVFMASKRSFFAHALLLPLVLFLEVAWYSTVAICFSNPRLQSLYLTFRKWVDRIAATMLGILGATIMFV